MDRGVANGVPPILSVWKTGITTSIIYVQNSQFAETDATHSNVFAFNFGVALFDDVRHFCPSNCKTQYTARCIGTHANPTL